MGNLVDDHLCLCGACGDSAQRLPCDNLTVPYCYCVLLLVYGIPTVPWTALLCTLYIYVYTVQYPGRVTERVES